MKQIPLFGDSLKSISPNLTGQRRVNCYYDIRDDGDKNIIAIKGTPGLTLFATLPTSPIRGFTEAAGYLYVVAGQGVYQVNQIGGWIYLFTIPTAGTNPVSIGINETQIMIVDGIAGYIFSYTNLTGNAATTISSLISEVSVLTQITLQTGNN